ncbi:MAG: DMT family transporter, partial [Candidatus Limnocylindria bacterium]
MDRLQGRIAPDRATLLAFGALVLFGGGNAIAVKATVAELAPFWGAALRFILAGLLMSAIVVVVRRPFPRGRSLTGAVLYGVVGLAASFAFVYPALRDTPAGTAMVLLSLMPLMTFGLAIAQRQERFHAQGVAGALIALAGVAVVFADQLSAAVPLPSLILILLGTAAVAEGGVIVKFIPHSDPFSTNAVAMLVAAVILLGLALAAGEPLVLPAQGATWAGVGYLVVIGSVVLFSLYLFTLERWT